jgi:FkbM family methyltransferase
MVLKVKIINTLLKRFNRNFFKESYSQCGEDLIIDFILSSLKINSPSHLDIGAHHPIYLNNTYLLYLKGSRGVCIEPDPKLFAELQRERKNDICLNVGIGLTKKKYADFYIISSRTLNTFSKDTAERYESYGNQKIEEIIKIPLVSVNDIISQYYNIHPSVVSLDVEGWEMPILTSFNFGGCRPEIFCIETLTYAEDKSESKLLDVIEFMKSKDYFVYADTYINTIFVEINVWKNR